MENLHIHPGDKKTSYKIASTEEDLRFRKYREAKLPKTDLCC